MVFVIGGSYQGKREFVKAQFHAAEGDCFVCTEETREIDFSKRVIEHIERFALGCVRRGEEPKAYWMAHLGDVRDSVLISDDISCGVVPVDAEVRAWREANGRANNAIAGAAEQVWRVFCGLGQRLK